MNAAKQAVWLFMTLIALACSGWYFASSTPTVKLDAETLSNIPDMTVNHLSVTRFDINGQLINSLSSPLMHHIPLNDTHWFKDPVIVVAQPNQPPWEIRAGQATSLSGGNEITFKKDVIIHQGQDEGTQESTMKTQALTYFPKNKLATTDLEVTYERPGNTVKSTGMKAYLAEKRVLLLSKARGIYEPKRG